MDDTIFRDHLLEGETVLWSGRPASGLLFVPSDLLVIPLSLLWCGGVVTAILTAPWTRPPLDIVVRTLFFASGLFVLVGRFGLDRWLRARTYYGVTDRRILILRTAPFPSFRALDFDRLPMPELVQTLSGGSTIRFGGPLVGRLGRRAGLIMPSTHPTPQFLAIDDAPQVLALIRDAVQQRRPAAAGE